MKLLMIIGMGSFAGGILRYVLSQFVQAKVLTTFPIGTLAVNLTGCFLIGIAMGLAKKGGLSQEWQLFFATGLLGGFTTFSAFSMETISLLRIGETGIALSYVLASMLIGLFATFVGISITD